MPFLKDLVHCDESFEGLHFVGEDWLPAGELAMLALILLSYVIANKPQVGFYGTNGMFQVSFGVHRGCASWISMRQANELDVAQSRGLTYTFIPCQKLWELLWSHVYTMHARTCFPAP
jgi:hypothetical protein